MGLGNRWVEKINNGLYEEKSFLFGRNPAIFFRRGSQLCSKLHLTVPSACT